MKSIFCGGQDKPDAHDVYFAAGGVSRGPVLVGITMTTAGAPSRRSLILFFASLVLGGSIAVLPTPSHLPRSGQLVLAVTAAVVAMWMFRVLATGIVSLVMLPLMVLAGVQPAVVLSGFASPSFWILVAVLFYGYAMEKTRLAQRIAYYTLSLFPVSYLGISTAFFTIGLVLTFGIPSSTVRTAIMVPIAWALVKSLGLENQSRGSALIMLTAVEMAVVPGSVVLFGSLFGLIVDTLFHTLQIPISYLDYLKVLGLPTILFSVMLIFINQFIMRPEPIDHHEHGFARHRLREMGTLSRDEWITLAIVLISVGVWSTERLHHLPSFAVGLLFIPVLFLTGIVREQQIGTAVSWNLLLFLGGAFSLASIIQQYQITDWVALYLIPAAEYLAFSPMLLLVGVAVCMLALRFVDPAGFIAIPVMFFPLYGVAKAANIPPLVLMAPLLFAAAPFWFTYQSPWVAQAEGFTDNCGFSGSQRGLLSTVYAITTLLAVVVSVIYWKFFHYL